MDVHRAGVREATVAGAGFINFKLETATAASGLAGVIAAGETYGRHDEGKGASFNVEFVSANPTGPLHVGHGRQAALGDAIASLLEWIGWSVTREFYYNDAGVQIQNLALSVRARLVETATGTLEIPEGGYHGEYIREIAAAYADAHPDDPTGRAARAVRDVCGAGPARGAGPRPQGVRCPVRRLLPGVVAVHATARSRRPCGCSATRGTRSRKAAPPGCARRTTATTRTASCGSRTARYTYFVPDVAYHVTKWQRGFRHAINVQGADHHSTVVRVRAGLQALDAGIPKGYPEYQLHQMVTVMRGGEEVKISKRAGSYVTVRDLVDEVGRDAVRYFLLMRKADTPLTFDVDLARTQSEENPVYYIQMAHARMSGIFRVGEHQPGVDQR